MQGYNRYYPPDHDVRKTLNQVAGRHPLGNRGRKAGQGIIIVRFEMPFAIWCGGCEKLIAQGVRFNAEKKKIGDYYSTPVWSFGMKCHLCSHRMEIHTDPKHAEYVVAQGARRKAEEWDTSDAGVVQLDRPKDEDPFVAVERRTRQEQRVQEQAPQIEALQDWRDRQWADPYSHSQRLRSEFRADKKEKQQRKDAREAFRTKHGLHIDLLDASLEDAIEAKKVDYAPRRSARQSLAIKKSEQIFSRQEGSKFARDRLRETLRQRPKHNPFHAKGS